jgi:hypothetical protein
MNANQGGAAGSIPMTKTKVPTRRMGSVMLVGIALLASSSPAATRTVQVNADGTFTPKYVFIHDGETVEWRLSNPTHSIIPIDPEGASDICSAYKPYHPRGVNEFTGPMPRAASGIFTLGPDGSGFVVKSGAEQCSARECKAASVGAGATTQCLCQTGESAATMGSTWGDPDITGVFIRLRWKDVHTGPGQFDWTAMDREITKAVQNGKLYSLAFKAGHFGTPEWIFNPLLSPHPRLSRLAPQPARALRIEFRDHGGGDGENDDGEGNGGNPCGTLMYLGSPADQVYRDYYFELLSAAADRVRANNAWYRALAYFKPSGVNLFSHENRAPKNCDTNCSICNTQRWAVDGKYKPTKLYDFYRDQTELLADPTTGKLPDKDLSYMLIHAGFPLVNDQGEYAGQTQPLKNDLPGMTEQTAHLIEDGIDRYGARFAVQHNGLGPLCAEDGDGQTDDCTPNYMAVNKGKQGQIIGFQTNNKAQVGNSFQLEAALQNGYCNSDATFFEIYEERLWEVRMKTGSVLDPNAVGSAIAGCNLPIATNRSLGSWGAMLHERRKTRGVALSLPEAFPQTHQHTFKRTTEGDVQTFTYVQGAKCTADKYGAVVMVPNGTWKTAVAGYDRIGPTQKPTLATVYSLPAVATNAAVALREISISESGDESCALSVSFGALPGQMEPATDRTIHSALSGPVTCVSPKTLGSAKFTDGEHFARGVRVCTNGAVPRVQGIELYAAKVDEDGTVTPDANADKRFAASGCNTWSAARYCRAGEVAVGVTGYFTDGGGFSGVALQCRAIHPG